MRERKSYVIEKVNSKDRMQIAETNRCETAIQICTEIRIKRPNRKFVVVERIERDIF
jgi:hypothetical protein